MFTAKDAQNLKSERKITELKSRFKGFFDYYNYHIGPKIMRQCLQDKDYILMTTHTTDDPDTLMILEKDITQIIEILEYLKYKVEDLDLGSYMIKWEN